jgi:hypothetical protein
MNDETGYCRFDFKSMFDDGDEVIRRDINVCEISTYTITEVANPHWRS